LILDDESFVSKRKRGQHERDRSYNIISMMPEKSSYSPKMAKVS
jgi:hypothetical protein